MGSKRGPAAPDPYATAQAQGQVNADTARTQARLNRTNTVTPFGSTTWANNGDEWTATLALSPEQQRIYQQGVGLETGANQLALDMLPQARSALMQPMALDDPDARNRATAGIMSRLEPQFARDRTALESRLVAQGFTPGTEAYRQAADELNRSITDTRLQADAAGMAESRAGAGFANAVRGQRINELAMLFGLGPGMQMPGQAQGAPAGVNAPDLAGTINGQYQQQMARQGANNAAFGQAAGGAMTAAATVAAAFI